MKDQRPRYTLGWRVGNHIYVAGQLPFDKDGNLLGKGDIKAQTRRIFEQIKMIVEAGGGKISRAVRRGALGVLRAQSARQHAGADRKPRDPRRTHRDRGRRGARRLRAPTMPKILVIHGAGMNMRGKVQLDVFGPMTLPEYDERIRGYAKELGVEVEIFHSNVEGEIVNKLYAANDAGVDAAIFNPAAFGSGYPALVAALSQVKFPTTEVHISNPIRRGPASQTAAVSQSVVAGFGIAGYALALRGIRDQLAAKK
jgi:3-dehydroquinate dehydratase-2